MNKTIVIGCPGSGKSTFSRSIHQITQLPLYYLDRLYWNADKTTVTRELFLERLKPIIGQDAWIIDGNYGSSLEMRMQACDTIFFLDYPLEVCLDGVMARRGQERPDMPWIEDSKQIDPEFLEFIHNFARDSRPAIIELLERYGHKQIHIFKGRQEADLFLRNLKK